MCFITEAMKMIPFSILARLLVILPSVRRRVRRALGAACLTTELMLASVLLLYIFNCYSHWTQLPPFIYSLYVTS